VSRRITSTVLLCVLSLVIGVQLGAYITKESGNFTIGKIVGQSDKPVAGDPEKTANINLLWTVWRTLQDHYIAPTELQQQKMVEGAAEGLVRAVGDPYTVYMSPQENQDFRQDLGGTLEGIGAELELRDTAIVIVAPIKGSPAQRAGLLPEDVILSVDGKTTEGMSLNDAVHVIRGKKGTTVTLSIFRKGEPEPLTVRIVREAIDIPTVDSRIIENPKGNVGYVSLNQFGEHSMPEIRKALDSFKGKELKGIILDLRYNGGGYLDGAVELVSMFQASGEVVRVQERDGPAQSRKVAGKPVYPDTPVVVLINQASASASEIVAGALQDHGRATIVGMKSYGKGTVQEVVDLPGGGSLRVTIARWLTPKGRDLGKEGVHPDIEIDLTQADVDAKKDPQLDAALLWLLEKKKPAVTQASSSSK